MGPRNVRHAQGSHTDDDALAQRREDELMALGAILSPDEFTLLSEKEDGSTRRTTGAQSVSLIVPGQLQKPNSFRIRSHIFTPTISPRESVEDQIASEHKLLATASAAGYSYRLESTDLCDLSFLPPIRMILQLPPGYPEHCPPQIDDIVVNYSTTTSFDARSMDNASIVLVEEANDRAERMTESLVTWIRSELLQSWNDTKSEILFEWFDTIQSIWNDPSIPCRGDEGRLFLDEYIIGAAKPSSVVPPHASSPYVYSKGERLATKLRKHDMISKRTEFEGERFGCGICLEEKRGGKCFRLSSCDHVFCHNCLTDYLSSMIREGYLRQAVTCPDPECVKSRVKAEQTTDAGKAEVDGVGVISEAELRLIVGPDLVVRLHELQEKAQASIDPSASFCPRPSCQRLVRGDPNDAGTSYEAMRQCSCGFTYCLYCSKAWHGKNPCHIVSSTALIEAYQRSAPGSVERRTMEIKYGRSNMERMVRNHEEEQGNRAWIEANTQSCPCCNVFINKSMGCNHITCKSCNTHFCYRCGTRLSAQEPYKHFNTLGTPCYMKLFDADVAFEGNHDDWDAILDEHA